MKLNQKLAVQDAIKNHTVTGSTAESSCFRITKLSLIFGFFQELKKNVRDPAMISVSN